MEKVNNDVGRSSSCSGKRAGSPVECPTPVKEGRKSQDAIKNPTEITSLPMEMMQQIFLNLNHSDLMSARAACGNWSDTITSRPFVTNFSFTLQRGETGNSYDTLNNSDVPWENLEIQNCNTSRYPTWEFPATLDTSLKSLTITGCSFTWSWLVSITREFQSLEKLTLRKCIMEPEIEVTGSGLKRPLVLKLELAQDASSNACLEKFLDDASSPFSLSSLEISVPYHKYDESAGHWATVVPESVEAVERFSKLINSCKQELFFQINTSQGFFVWSTSVAKEIEVETDVNSFEDYPVAPIQFNADFLDLL